MPVSSSNKGLDEDETGAERLFPDALYHELSKETFWEKLDQQGQITEKSR